MNPSQGYGYPPGGMYASGAPALPGMYGAMPPGAAAYGPVGAQYPGMYGVYPEAPPPGYAQMLAPGHAVPMFAPSQMYPGAPVVPGPGVGVGGAHQFVSPVYPGSAAPPPGHAAQYPQQGQPATQGQTQAGSGGAQAKGKPADFEIQRQKLMSMGAKRKGGVGIDMNDILGTKSAPSPAHPPGFTQPQPMPFAPGAISSYPAQASTYGAPGYAAAGFTQPGFGGSPLGPTYTPPPPPLSHVGSGFANAMGAGPLGSPGAALGGPALHSFSPQTVGQLGNSNFAAHLGSTAGLFGSPSMSITPSSTSASTPSALGGGGGGWDDFVQAPAPHASVSVAHATTQASQSKPNDWMAFSEPAAPSTTVSFSAPIASTFSAAHPQQPSSHIPSTSSSHPQNEGSWAAFSGPAAKSSAEIESWGAFGSATATSPASSQPSTAPAASAFGSAEPPLSGGWASFGSVDETPGNPDEMTGNNDSLSNSSHPQTKDAPPVQANTSTASAPPSTSTANESSSTTAPGKPSLAAYMESLASTVSQGTTKAQIKRSTHVPKTPLVSIAHHVVKSESKSAARNYGALDGVFVTDEYGDFQDAAATAAVAPPPPPTLSVPTPAMADPNLFQGVGFMAASSLQPSGAAPPPAFAYYPAASSQPLVSAPAFNAFAPAPAPVDEWSDFAGSTNTPPALQHTPHAGTAQYSASGGPGDSFVAHFGSNLSTAAVVTHDHFTTDFNTAPNALAGPSSSVAANPGGDRLANTGAPFTSTRSQEDSFQADFGAFGSAPKIAPPAQQDAGNFLSSISTSATFTTIAATTPASARTGMPSLPVPALQPLKANDRYAALFDLDAGSSAATVAPQPAADDFGDFEGPPPIPSHTAPAPAPAVLTSAASVTAATTLRAPTQGWSVTESEGQARTSADDSFAAFVSATPPLPVSIVVAHPFNQQSLVTGAKSTLDTLAPVRSISQDPMWDNEGAGVGDGDSSFSAFASAPLPLPTKNTVDPFAWPVESKAVTSVPANAANTIDIFSSTTLSTPSAVDDCEMFVVPPVTAANINSRSFEDYNTASVTVNNPAHHTSHINILPSNPFAQHIASSAGVSSGGLVKQPSLFADDYGDFAGHGSEADALPIDPFATEPPSLPEAISSLSSSAAAPNAEAKPTPSTILEGSKQDSVIVTEFSTAPAPAFQPSFVTSSGAHMGLEGMIAAILPGLAPASVATSNKPYASDSKASDFFGTSFVPSTTSQQQQQQQEQQQPQQQQQQRDVHDNNDDEFSDFSSHAVSPGPFATSSSSVGFAAFGAPASSSAGGDRYGVFADLGEGSNTKPQRAEEWMRILDKCVEELRNATNIVNEAAATGVLKEVTESTKGANYFQALIEIHRVGLRIAHSSTALEAEHQDLQQRSREFSQLWKQLLQRSSVLASRENDDAAPPHNGDGLCSVCLQNTHASAGRAIVGALKYHITCANFWLNRIDRVLPTLAL